MFLMNRGVRLASSVQQDSTNGSEFRPAVNYDTAEGSGSVSMLGTLI